MSSSCADVCLLVEGAYPYVSGGVSSWLHDLIKAQPEIRFHIVALVPDRSWQTLSYPLPPNVIGLSHVYLQDMPVGKKADRKTCKMLKKLGAPLLALQSAGGLQELRQILDILSVMPKTLGRRTLLNSPAAWQTLCDVYEQILPDSSFLNYFWTWRALFGGLFSCLIAPLPEARVYHAISTGYAGLVAARAKLQTGRPVMLTEHGIYNNERRIEVMMAEWLDEGEDASAEFRSADIKKELRSIWMGVFSSYAQATYAAADKIITLYPGNQPLQLRDGADLKKMLVVPNGIDLERFRLSTGVAREETLPTIGLIGRVVPIKDIKTFIRACAKIINHGLKFQALILGPTDEDKGYFEECRQLVAHLSLSNVVTFVGRVKLEEYLPRLDLVILTSISEAQPLVILEAGAAGIPVIATDVGACRDMLLGAPDEHPPLGAGGVVTSLISPESTAHAIISLLGNDMLRQQYGEVLLRRVERYYDKRRIDGIYRKMYTEMANE